MAIYLDYTNKTLNYYSVNPENLSQIKEISKSFLAKNDAASEKVDSALDDEPVFETEEDQAAERDAAKSPANNLNYEEKEKFVWQLQNFESNDTLQNFLNEFSSDQSVLPEDALKIMKLEKQFLVLPDEIVLFDNITTPILSFWKVGQALKLKLSIDFNKIENYSYRHRLIKKNTQNVTYTVQLVKNSVVKNLYNYFSNNGIKIKGMNFYSDALASFYLTHLKNAKNAAVIVKVSENQTTILAIVHGFLVGMESFACGEKDIFKTAIYRLDEFSKKYLSHKFVCYAIGKLTDSSLNTTITKEHIEKAYPKTKLNPSVGNFQPKSINCIDLVRKKVDDMIMFLANSSFGTAVESVYVDVKNEEVFNKLNIKNAVKIYYTENEIFESNKNSKMLNSCLISSKNTNKGILGKIWSKGKKKA